MSHSKLGTITASEDRYMEWKSKSGDYEETKYANFTTLFEGVFKKCRFLDIIKNFVLFSKGENKFKIISAYHQYFAVNKAIERTIQALNRLKSCLYCKKM